MSGVNINKWTISDDKLNNMKIKALQKFIECQLH